MKNTRKKYEITKRLAKVIALTEKNRLRNRVDDLEEEVRELKILLKQAQRYVHYHHTDMVDAVAASLEVTEKEEDESWKANHPF